MGLFRLLYRVPWALFHLVFGLPLTLLSIRFPLRPIRIGGKGLDVIMLNWFSGTTCTIFGIRRQIHGNFKPGAALVVANHISWLDIQLLHSISPMGFVAKAEINAWPLAGRVAAMGDTVYHQRGSHDSASGVNQAMVEKLQQGKKVAIFAEGGILPGDSVKRFHARMFAAAIETDTPVQPVMIRYMRAGQRYPDITFLRGEGFMGNLLRLLKQGGCTAEVVILPLVAPAGKRRREIAQASEEAVRAAFEAGTRA